MAVDRLEVGKWYRWIGPTIRTGLENWVPRGNMDFVFSREPLQVTWSDDGGRATFAGPGDRTWQWNENLQYFEEVPEPGSAEVRKGIERFEVGKYYRWIGPKEGHHNWVSNMEYMADGKPRRCLETLPDEESAAAFEGDDELHRVWRWGPLSNFEEVPAPPEKKNDRVSLSFELGKWYRFIGPKNAWERSPTEQKRLWLSGNAFCCISNHKNREYGFQSVYGTYIRHACYSSALKAGWFEEVPAPEEIPRVVDARGPMTLTIRGHQFPIHPIDFTEEALTKQRSCREVRRDIRRELLRRER